MSKEIKDLYRRALAKGAKNIAVPRGKKGVHTQAFHSCVTKVAKSGDTKNPYAICMSRLGKEKAVKKAHRKTARPGE